MTKIQLAEKIREKLCIQRKDSVELVESVLEIMKSTLEAGEEIKIAGFGVFKVRNKSDRKGRNPQTGDALIVAGRKVITFKVSHLLKSIINCGHRS